MKNAPAIVMSFIELSTRPAWAGFSSFIAGKLLRRKSLSVMSSMQIGYSCAQRYPAFSPKKGIIPVSTITSRMHVDRHQHEQVANARSRDIGS